MSKAPVICYYCEKVFMGGPYAFVCPICRKKRLSESAKKRAQAKKTKGGVK